MKIVLTYELGELWADKETLDSMTDAEVIELLNEDMFEVWSQGRKQIVRG